MGSAHFKFCSQEPHVVVNIAPSVYLFKNNRTCVTGSCSRPVISTGIYAYLYKYNPQFPRRGHKTKFIYFALLFTSPSHSNVTMKHKIPSIQLGFFFSSFRSLLWIRKLQRHCGAAASNSLLIRKTICLGYDLRCMWFFDFSKLAIPVKWYDKRSLYTIPLIWIWYKKIKLNIPDGFTRTIQFIYTSVFFFFIFFCYLVFAELKGIVFTARTKIWSNLTLPLCSVKASTIFRRSGIGVI